MELTTVIPVFNGERFLQTTLECLAMQSRRPDRVVVIDNGSTDRTPELVKGFRGIACEFHQNPTNLGVIGNLNRCLDFASETRFLHLLMADDLVTPDFFAKVLPPCPKPRVGPWDTVSMTRSISTASPSVPSIDGPQVQPGGSLGTNS